MDNSDEIFASRPETTGAVTRGAEAFQRCFVAWVAALIGVPEGVAAIDGKTVRRSKGAAKDATHMASAFAARQRLGLGRVKVADKAKKVLRGAAAQLYGL